MTADALITGRYSGSVGDFQDGVAMTIDFYWQLVNDEFIIGYLTSTVNREGMTCNMFRTFDLRYMGD